MRRGDGHHRGRGDRRVDRVAATLEDGSAGRGRKMIGGRHGAVGREPGEHVARYRSVGADRDLERQLGQAAPAAAAAVARRAPARRRLPAGDQARRRRVRRAARRRARRRAATPSPSHGEAAWNGVAILSRVGLDDVVVGTRRARPASRIRRRARSSATCGGIRVVSVYVPERPRARLRALPATSSPGWRRCARWSPPAPRRRSSAAT